MNFNKKIIFNFITYLLFSIFNKIFQCSGLDEKNVSKIFERFYSDRPDDSSVNHSGLGLNIVKNIIDSHKGSIKAYNFSKKSNSGAVIDIQLPVRK